MRFQLLLILLLVQNSLSTIQASASSSTSEKSSMQTKSAAELATELAVEKLHSSLDHSLKSRGFTQPKVFEGSMTETQKKQFLQQLSTYRSINFIAEIGLNAGYSAENFFQSCPNIKQFVSFDLNQHRYTSAAVDYFQYKYKDRFMFIPGDSKLKVPEFARISPQKFDLIYIDGDHSYNGCKVDIENCKALAHKGTMLWIDDYRYSKVEAATQNCQDRGIIQVIKIHSSKDPKGKRCWAEARYRF